MPPGHLGHLAPPPAPLYLSTSRHYTYVFIITVTIMTQEFHNSLRLNSTFSSTPHSANNNNQSDQRRHQPATLSPSGAAAGTTQPAERAVRPPTMTAASLHSTGTDVTSSHVTVSNYYSPAGH